MPQNSRDTATLHEAAGDLHTLLGEYSAALQAYESDVAHAHLARSLALSAATVPSPRVAALNNLAHVRGATGQLDAALRNHRADLLHRADRE